MTLYWLMTNIMTNTRTLAIVAVLTAATLVSEVSEFMSLFVRYIA
jgi:hypothetical protein